MKWCPSVTRTRTVASGRPLGRPRKSDRQRSRPPCFPPCGFHVPASLAGLGLARVTNVVLGGRPLSIIFSPITPKLTNGGDPAAKICRWSKLNSIASGTAKTFRRRYHEPRPHPSAHRWLGALAKSTADCRLEIEVSIVAASKFAGLLCKPLALSQQSKPSQEKIVEISVAAANSVTQDLVPILLP